MCGYFCQGCGKCPGSMKKDKLIEGQCAICGEPLPPDVPNCPHCGAPAPVVAGASNATAFTNN